MLLSLLVFVSVACAVAGIVLCFMPNAAQRRLGAMSGGPRSSGWNEAALRVAAPLAQLSAPDADWQTSRLRLKFLQAGVRHPDARLWYFAAKTLLPALAGLAAFVWLRAAAGGLHLALDVALAAVAGCYLPDALLHVQARRRRREIFESFPDAADLVLVCVEAGLALEASLVKVAEELRISSPPLAQELHLSNLETRAGRTREQSLRDLALRCGVEEIATFASIVAQADRFGTNVGAALRVFSDDLRHKRRLRAQEQAAKMSTKMLFPIVVCIFPSIVMVILAPALIQIVRTLVPMLGGA
jgi:tight adherence protein C